MTYKNSLDYPIDPKLLQISNYPYYECFPKWTMWEDLCSNNNVDAEMEIINFTQWEQVSSCAITNNSSSSTGPVRRKRTNKIPQYTLTNPRRSDRVRGTRRDQPQQQQ